MKAYDTNTLILNELGCVDSGGETPVPFPNTEVKPTRGDGTAVLTVGE